MGKKIHKFWHHLLRHKYGWTFLLFLIFEGFLEENSFYHRYSLRKDNAELREQIRQAEEEYDNADRQLRALGHSQKAYEEVARVRLFMKKADEDIYIIEK